MSLPKVHRLRHRRDFSRVYRYGIRRGSRGFVMRALKVSKTANASPPSGDRVRRVGQANDLDRRMKPPYSRRASEPSAVKIGISISNKVSKRASIRNRMRRQIKAAMFSLVPTLPSGWHIVIIARPSATECDYWQILTELREMVKMLR